MLHILLLALKWIGIILAVLLGILLLAVLLVLFCPFRYRVRFEKNADKWEIKGHFGWLFGLVSATVQKGSVGSFVRVRICGVQPSTVKRFFFRKKTVKKKAVKKTAVKEETVKEENVKEQAVEKPQPSLEKKESREKRQETLPELSVDERDRTSPDQRIKKVWKIKNPIRNLWKRISEKVRGIWRAFKNFFSKIRNLCGKIELWKKFLQEEQTKAAVRLGIQEVLRLLRHIRPRKWEGTVELGLGDPATTGQALAVLGALYPVYRKHFSVTPVWDGKFLEGKARAKGRLYGIILVYVAIKLYFDKNVKYVMQWFRGGSASG